jgi:hypothetical protein
MTTMSDAEIIAWAKHVADVYTNEPDLTLSTRYRRLADLAEKATEDWQPIASAPESTDPMGKHQIELLVSDPYEGITIAVRRLGWWYEAATDDRLFPTHWRPLPAPPGGER